MGVQQDQLAALQSIDGKLSLVVTEQQLTRTLLGTNQTDLLAKMEVMDSNLVLIHGGIENLAKGRR
jgi:hypothetical protein